MKLSKTSKKDGLPQDFFIIDLQYKCASAARAHSLQVIHCWNSMRANANVPGKVIVGAKGEDWSQAEVRGATCRCDVPRGLERGKWKGGCAMIFELGEEWSEGGFCFERVGDVPRELQRGRREGDVPNSFSWSKARFELLGNVPRPAKGLQRGKWKSG